jgi:ATP-dependent Clp protease ATP-binding subunit ClpA
MIRRDNRFDKFTARARTVLKMAEESAKSFDHNYIGTEHLLLGLLMEGEGVAAKALQELGATLDLTRAKVLEMVGPGDPAKAVGLIGLTPRGKKVIELGVAEARRLKHPFIGTEHLLLGILDEGEGVAVGALHALGVTSDAARNKTLELLDSALRGGALDQAPIRRDNVIACRVEDDILEAIDALVEAGVRTTRSDAANWLIRAGVASHEEFLTKAKATASQVRELRSAMQALA